MSTTPTANIPSKARKSYTLWIIIIVSILPIAGAYFVYFTGIGVPKNTVNKGVLLDDAVSLQSLMDDAMWQDINTDKKWHLLLPLSDTCEGVCKANMYTTRQVHIRLAQRSERLDRLAYIIDGSFDDKKIEEIKQKHPLLRIINLPGDVSGYEKWSSWRAQISAERSQDEYFLVDQEGRAMMRYSSEQHGNDLLKDIKRALKSSIDYQ